MTSVEAVTSSSSSEAREVSAFRSAAKRFYATGDEEAGAVLLRFDELSAFFSSSSQQQQDNAVVVIDAQEEDPYGLSAATRDPVLRAAYLRAKDDARKEVHALSLSERRSTLKAALFDEPSHDNGPSTAFSNVKRAVGALRRFAHAYGGDVAAQPLLRGAIAFLVEQQRSTRVLRWVLDAAVLTETGGPTYVRDVVDLFRELPLLRVDVNLPESLSLELDPNWSDANLHRLIRTCKAHRPVIDAAGPTGHILHTDRPRLNSDGNHDDALCLDGFCLDLGIFFS